MLGPVAKLLVWRAPQDPPKANCGGDPHRRVFAGLRARATERAWPPNRRRRVGGKQIVGAGREHEDWNNVWRAFGQPFTLLADSLGDRDTAAFRSRNSGIRWPSLAGTQ